MINGTDTSLPAKPSPRKTPSTLKRKIGRFSSVIFALLVGAAVVAHKSRKEYPDTLPETTLSGGNIGWNKQTKDEIHKLAKEYAIIYSRRQSAAKMTQEGLEKKFLHFIATYGPDIHIAQLEKNDNAGPTRLLHRWWYEGPNRAHYYAGTLTYDIQDMQKDRNDNYDPRTSSLDVFLAELSHYINDDTSLPRGVAYAEDFIGTGFSNKKMYPKISSSEYQAHEITEQAILAFLNPDNTYSFPEVFNLYHDYYRKIMDGEDYEAEIDKSYLHDGYKTGDVESLLQYKEGVFSNIDTIRKVINATGFDTEKKSLLFRYLINKKFPFEEPIDYAQLAQDANLSRVDSVGFLGEFYSQSQSEGQ